MPLQRMPKLVVAEIQRGRGRALVEAIGGERILQERSLIFGNCGAQVARAGGEADTAAISCAAGTGCAAAAAPSST